MRLCPTFSDCAESALLVDFGPQFDRRLSLSILQVSKVLEASMLHGTQGKHSRIDIAYSALRPVGAFQGKDCRGDRAFVRGCRRRAGLCADLGNPRCLWRRRRPGPGRSCPARRTFPGRGDRASCRAGLPRLHAGFPSGLCLSWRSSKKAGDAAPGHAARFGASGIGGDRRGANRDIPDREVLAAGMSSVTRPSSLGI